MVTAQKKSSTCTLLSMQVLSHLLTNLAEAIFITIRFEVALGDLCVDGVAVRRQCCHCHRHRRFDILPSPFCLRYMCVYCGPCY